VRLRVNVKFVGAISFVAPETLTSRNNGAPNSPMLRRNLVLVLPESSLQQP
jgi:hypothetical protein